MVRYLEKCLFKGPNVHLWRKWALLSTAVLHNCFLNAEFCCIGLHSLIITYNWYWTYKTESLSLTCCEMVGRLDTRAVRVPVMTCRWQSRASSQNCRAARHTAFNRSQHRERLRLETSSQWTGLRVRETQTFSGKCIVCVYTACVTLHVCYLWVFVCTNLLLIWWMSV